MKTRFLLGPVLILLWFVTLAVFPSVLDTFKDFKVEIPALSMFWIVFYHAGGGLLVGAWAVGAAAFLALGWRFGWWFTMAMSALLDVFCLSVILPMISLANSLSGGDDALLPLRYLF